MRCLKPLRKKLQEKECIIPAFWFRWGSSTRDSYDVKHTLKLVHALC